MKYYSEKTKGLYDSLEELEKAEAEILQTKENIVVSKKQLAQKVEQSDTAYDEAFSDYEKAKDEVNNLVKETKDRISKILDEPTKKLQKARDERFNALSDFNRNYGVYTTTYSPERVKREYDRFASIDNLVNRLFDDWNFPSFLF